VAPPSTCRLVSDFTLRLCKFLALNIQYEKEERELNPLENARVSGSFEATKKCLGKKEMVKFSHWFFYPFAL